MYTLHHASSSLVITRHTSFVSSALFIVSTLIRPAPPLSLGLHKMSQLSRWSLLFSAIEPYTHYRIALFNSLWTHEGNFWSCIWNTAMLFRTECTLDKHFAFHPSSFFFTFSNSLLCPSLHLPWWSRWWARWRPNLNVLRAPILSLNLAVTWLGKYGEKKINDLLKLICWHDALQKFLGPSLMQSTWSSTASTNRRRSFAKNKCDVLIPPLEAFNGLHVPLSTLLYT